MKLARIVSDELTETDVETLHRLYRANNKGYLASGHMDSETAQLFAEAVNALPKLLKVYEDHLKKIRETREATIPEVQNDEVP